MLADGRVIDRYDKDFMFDLMKRASTGYRSFGGIAADRTVFGALTMRMA
jgi:hypothetical protein